MTPSSCSKISSAISRRVKGCWRRALNGSKEIGFTIISMTLSLVAVFIPVLFMGGIIGRLLHEFAVTIGVAILVSGFVSLTLTPMLCSRFLRPAGEEHHTRIYDVSERFFKRMLRAYERSLKLVLQHRRAVLIVSALIFVVTIFLFVVIPKGFLPSEDTGQIFGITEAAQGISFDSMKEHQLKVAAIVRQDPNVSFLYVRGGTRWTLVGTNTGRVFIRLKPRSERRLSADQVIQELRPKLAQIPGIRVFLQNPPPIRIGGTLTKSQYQFTLQSPNTKELVCLCPAARGKAQGIADAPGCDERLADHEPSGQRSRSTGTRPRPWA